MKKEAEIKYVQIPLDINELRDYKELHKLLQICNKFISNSESYIKKIIFGEYIKPYREWIKILTPEDIDRITPLCKATRSAIWGKDEKENTLIYHSIGDNTFGYFGKFHFSPTTGCSTSKPTRYEFNEDGTIIYIISEYGTASTRTGNWTPQQYNWHFDTWELNLVTKCFKLKSSQNY